MWKSLIALGMLASSASAMAQTHQLKIDDCHIDGIKEQIKCGTLTVPENYNKPDAVKIDVNFTVLPAIDNSSNKVPLMFLAGGPGQAATELSAMLRRNYYEIRKTRDIVLVDQRGTGKSNPLLCDNEAFKATNVYTMSSSDYNIDEIHSCLAEFKQDLSQYNSENAIRDFDAVREALGHQQINIYGGSYGTRAALVYMRLFPQNLKSVVLDSVGPIEVPIGPFGQSAARSFSLLIENCHKDAECKKAFPNLEQEYQQVFERLVKSPIEIAIPHPRLGTEVKFLIDAEKFVSTLRLQLYSMGQRTLVPLVINQAYKGNFMPFAGLVAMNDEEQAKGSLYFGLTLNIVCNEDFPLVDENAWLADADNSFGRNISHRAWRLACPVWPKYRPDAEFYQSVTADIPTLILSGNLDPVTPPANGDKSDATLPNSKHIVVKNAAHIVANTDCGVGVVAQFLDSLDVSSLDEECLAEIPDESFMTSLNGNM
ncbi:alpha/beta hydrolase [Thalassotalea sp. M1531]|uniref:Alpha/beta hydrolase n=1 Tax=Thalassotalea algicola TaxID=2716224 RepID=A0A7Y0LAB7_9GAMM|nr:alpha/beta fold hydrolase [Thalassotalea algicola]NMP30883.1 alpha/beta hydrolase [Thalassotalea algicola]